MKNGTGIGTGTPAGGNPLDDLRNLRHRAPPDFARRVMDALPDEPDDVPWRRLRSLWPDHGRWWLPALAGAAAALLAATFLPRPAPAPADNRIAVHFELKAPEAKRVELVGNFTGWKADAVQLRGPDALGCWSIDLPLPPGRHEYIFLVDGTQWTTDPRAVVRRDDGFGRENAIVDL